MLMFPKSLVDQFRHHNTGLRYGQAFHQFAKLEQVKNPSDYAFCQQLYQEPDDARARAMIQSRTDLTQ